MKAAQVLMEILRAEGVRYLFGNPGTTELTFLDALPDSGLEYILALQEATAVAAADGSAQAWGTGGGVNLTVAPGGARAPPPRPPPPPDAPSRWPRLHRQAPSSSRSPWIS